MEALAVGSDGPSAADRAHVIACEHCSRTLEVIRENLSLAPLLRTSHSESSPGSVGEVSRNLVPGYHLLEELHRGGQGIVYRAVQQPTNREVAIKTLLSGTFASEKQRQRFALEAELASSLQHPCIATVHELVSFAGGRLAIAMELIRGPRIDHYAWRGATPRDRLQDALRVMISIGEAVAHAHRNGIIHRDLKPSNILIDESGSPRLLDFGIARRTNLSEGLTMTHEAMWTLAFASPEQLRDPAHVDSRTDVYSLGVLFYQLLAGKPPYEVSSIPLPEGIRVVCDHVPNRLMFREEFGSRPAPLDWASVIACALEKRASDRYQTVEALVEDLRRLAAGTAVHVPRLGASYYLRKFVRKRWKSLSIATVLGVGLSVGWIRISSERTRADNALKLARFGEVHSRATESVLMQTIGPLQLDLTQDPPSPARAGLDSLAIRLDMGAVSNDRWLEASLRSVLARVYEVHGLFDESERQSMEALRSLDSLDLDDPIDHQLHATMVDRSRLSLARSLISARRFEQAARVSDQIASADDPLIGFELAVLRATILLETGGEAEAANAVDGARAKWGRAGSPPMQEASIHELERRLAQRGGDFQAARRHADAAFNARLRTNLGEDHRVLEALRSAAQSPNPRGLRYRAAGNLVKLLNSGQRFDSPETLAYWDLACAEIEDPATRRYLDFHHPIVVQQRLVSTQSLARDQMFAKAMENCVAIWEHLNMPAPSEVGARIAVAVHATDWSLANGNVAVAELWALRALELSRERTSAAHPETRLPGLALTAGDLAARRGNYAEAIGLLREARDFDIQISSGRGVVFHSATFLEQLIAFAQTEAADLPHVSSDALYLLRERPDLDLVRMIRDALSKPDPEDGVFRDFEPVADVVRRNEQLLATSHLHRTFFGRAAALLREHGCLDFVGQLQAALRHARATEPDLQDAGREP